MSRYYLMYSDLHLRPERLSDCEIVLDSIFNIAMDLRDRFSDEIVIVNGGDTFNTRGLIRTGCLDVLATAYRKWAGQEFRQIILVGNHDQEDKAGRIHPMKVFEGFGEGWMVIDRPTIVDSFMCFPYMSLEAANDYIDVANKHPFKYDALVHWGICGAYRNDSNRDTDGVDPSVLKGFRNVFSGHYHCRNKFDNIQYIGSPMQQSLAEKSQAKGVLLFDSKLNKTEFIEIVGTSKYHDLEVSWTDDGKIVLPDVEAADGDFCRIKVVGDSDLCSSVSRDFLNAKYPKLNLNIERIVKDRHYSRLGIEVNELTDIRSIMKRYVEFVETDLDRKKLLDIGGSLVT